MRGRCSSSRNLEVPSAVSLEVPPWFWRAFYRLCLVPCSHILRRILDVSSEGLELLEEGEEVTGEEAETKGNMGHTESKYEPVHYSPEVGVVFNHLQSSVENNVCWHSTPSVNAFSTTPKHVRKSVSLQAVPLTSRIEDDEGPSSMVRRDSDSLYSDSPLSVTELQRLVKEGSLEVDLEGLRDCEDLGITTVTSLEQLEKQLVDIKDLCADMNGELGCLRFPPAPPLLPGDCGSSRKNSLSTTVSDYSISAAAATAEHSGQEVVNLHKRRAQFRGLLGGLSLDLTYLSSTSSPSSCSEETSQASLEWDSPRHGWTTLPRSRASRRSAAAALHSPVNGGSSLKLKRSQSSSFADQVDPVRARNNVADEMMPSLEWDDTGIHVYPERGNTVDEQDDDAMNRLFHAESLEMDLEAELASHRSSVDLSGEDRAADSALHSRNNSRSGSHSPRQSLPLPQRASSVDTSPVSPEVGRRTDFAKTVWSSEESGFQEEDHGSSSHTLSSLTLSPIDECENRVGSSYALSSQPLSPVQEEARSPPVRHSRDSAYSDSGLDTDLARAADAVGEPMDVVAYAEREWQGNTQRAHTVVKGYLQMVSDLGLSCVRRVRSDAYCVLRACLYQVLTRDLPLPPAAETLSYLRNSWKDGNTWLSHWSFASRLPWSGDDVLDGMESCLEALDKLKWSGGVREAWNSDPEVDVRCMEAVKLLMLVSALQLERRSDGSVPLFALLLFARDSSSTCEQLMLNHLNLTGDTTALSQMELYLLGYSLGVTIRIVRPDNHGTSDYVAFYPDCCLGEWPMVSLVTEDDRSYYIATES